MHDDGIGIAEMAEQCGLSVDTLRWYEKDGILPPIPRTPDGRRVYGQADAGLVSLLAALRQTGMTTQQMREFVTLLGEGAASHGRRITLLEEVRTDLMRQREAIESAQRALEAKIAHYEELIDAGLDCQGSAVPIALRAQQRTR